MKPLAIHGGVAATIWFVCAAAWALFELGLAIRVRGASGMDSETGVADLVVRHAST